MKKGPHGFTLIELLIAVAVVAILAVIAIPSYESYIVRSNRAAAKAALMDVAQREQQYMLDTRTYAATLVDLGIGSLPAEVARHYTIAIAVTATAPPGFTATATPLPAGRQAADGLLRINQAGVREPADKW
ncbi:MAG: prepilin-type N-terminal cleavage/methylation domain-containing protein [Betaproteobacteria bacterium]|nr:prepilin-type N-terminal cleavage/methylation domain-containing protein [Betaproteobacteria bacterium]